MKPAEPPADRSSKPLRPALPPPEPASGGSLVSPFLAVEARESDPFSAFADDPEVAIDEFAEEASGAPAPFQPLPDTAGSVHPTPHPAPVPADASVHAAPPTASPLEQSSAPTTPLSEAGSPADDIASPVAASPAPAPLTPSVSAAKPALATIAFPRVGPHAPASPPVLMPTGSPVPRSTTRLSLAENSTLTLGAAVIVLACVAVAAFLGLTSRTRTDMTADSIAARSSGSAQFESSPSGADVTIDGVVRGKTPLRITLPTGGHTLEISGPTGSRSLPLTIEEGVLVSQYVELTGSAPVTTPAAPATGRLEIATDPPGALVGLDGASRGMTPVSLEGVPVGDHVITLTSGQSVLKRTVKVTPGAAASVVASFNDPNLVATAEGRLGLTTPFELQVYQGGRLLGTSNAGALAMPVGRHEIELVNDELEFRTTMNVDIQATGTTSTDVAVPNGTLSLNAIPWAEVTVDGRPEGTTPLANLTVPVGRHEVVWHHPQHGERRQEVVVPARTPVRLSVDFTR